MRPSHTLADLVEMYRVPPATIVAWIVELGFRIRFEGGRYYVPDDAVAALLERHERVAPPTRRAVWSAS